MNSKILASMLLIGLVALSAAGGTWATFSDTETSKDNVFTAGIVDLEIDCDGDTDFGYDDQGNPAPINEVGGTLPKFFDYCSETDIKPGDSGEVTISLHLTGDSNDALLFMRVTNINDSEPTPDSEPEAAAECLLERDEYNLSNEITVTIWQDNYNGGCDGGCDAVPGDNTYQPCYEYLMYSGPLSGISDAYLEAYQTTATGSGVYYIGFCWELPCEVGNEYQGDATNFDVEFYAVQAPTLLNSNGCPECMPTPIVDAAIVCV